MNSTLSFGQRNFGNVCLGDKRRSKRLVELVDSMVRHPGGTLPHKLSRPADLRAFYRLVDCEQVTHAVLIKAHADETRTRIDHLPTDQVVLVLHDATELDFTSKTTLVEDLGQIGKGTRRGYICHNSLAVVADSGETLGLVSQILHHRADVPKDETREQKRERESRESRLWVQGAMASGKTKAGVVCVDVSDSLSDTYEYMAYEMTMNRHFVLRAKENRRLCDAIDGHSYLLDAMKSLPAIGQRPFTVDGSSKRKARETTLQISYSSVEINLPRKKTGEYENKTWPIWAVRVWEPDTPADEEPLEWILLTNVPIQNEAQAWQRIDWYGSRSIIEEFHKGMKTGCAIEKMQFTTTERLEPAIAIISAVTTTLLNLRDAARAPDAETRAATTVVDAEYVKVLSDHYGKRLGPNPTVANFYKHVARLGGHQNRKCDGFPGWITLWRG